MFIRIAFGAAPVEALGTQKRPYYSQAEFPLSAIHTRLTRPPGLSLSSQVISVPIKVHARAKG